MERQDEPAPWAELTMILGLVERLALLIARISAAMLTAMKSGVVSGRSAAKGDSVTLTCARAEIINWGG